MEGSGYGVLFNPNPECATFLDELDSLARMDLLGALEDKLSISLPLDLIDPPITIRGLKAAIMEIYKKEWNI